MLQPFKCKSFGLASTHLITAIRNGDLAEVQNQIDLHGIEYPCSSYVLLCGALTLAHKQIAKLLLLKGAKVNPNREQSVKLRSQMFSRTAIKELTPLHFAVHLLDEEIVELLLEKGALINAVAGPRSSTPLFEAVLYKKMEIIGVLLKHGADIMIADSSGKTPTQIAAEEGGVIVTKMLLEYGAEVQTTLYHAAQGGKLDTVKFLLSNGAQINTTFDDGVTPLHIATEHRHGQLVNFLLKEGADVNAQDIHGKTILCAAVESGCPITVNIVLSHRPDAKNKENQSAVSIALRCLKLSNKAHAFGEMIENLLSYGFTISDKEAEDPGVLFGAIKTGYVKTVRELIKRDSNLRMLRNSILSDLLPLYPPTLSNTARLANVLIKYGADENFYGVKGSCFKRGSILSRYVDFNIFQLLITDRAEIKNNPDMLRFAVWYGRSDIVECLLRHGVDVNSQDLSGRNALHISVLRQKNLLSPVNQRSRSNPKVEKEIVKLLLTYGANPNAPISMGGNSLLIAAQNNLIEIVEILVNAKGTDVNAADDNGNTALHHFVRKGNFEVSKFLLKKGANVNARNQDGFTPLHVSSTNGHLAVVQLLLKFGADIDSTCKAGTPLHVACQYGQRNVIRFLVEYCADVNCTNEDDLNPFECVALRTGLVSRGVGLVPRGPGRGIPVGYNTATGMESRDTVDFLLRHLVKMKSANLFLNDKNLFYIKPRLLEEWLVMPVRHRGPLIAGQVISYRVESSLFFLSQSYRHKCEDEVAAMKHEKVANSNFSYYALLVESHEKMVKLSANRSLAQSVSTTDFEKKFPTYAGLIKRRFQRGKWMRKLREKCGQNLLAILPQLPFLCIEQIISYLAVADLSILAYSTQPSEVKLSKTR